ncbi:amino acid ABC transporter permease [Pseudokineococcus sp. 1T1Z-3]|uniref:amino acid ABC transporter permease n=1 Tax=Pseudokineococcus sp. 1T1Z-3 TaxID=3132745 RepID=UPI00309F198B
MTPVLENLDLYVSGFFVSLRIALLAGVGALLLGAVLAAFRVSPVPVLQRFGAAYVTVFRNSPLAIVLYFFAFGLPAAGISAGGNYFVLGVSGLAMYTAAFVCEALRSGVNSVATGQAEAGRAIGLGFTQNLGLIVLPQAVRSVVPPVGNVLIAMTKNSAVVGALGVGGDLFSAYNRMTSALGYAQLPSLLGMAIGFLVMTLSAGALLALLERKLEIAR